MHDKPCPKLVAFLDRPEDARVLGPYRLVSQLGRGGFAPVWLAREMYGQKEFRTVAIKLFCVEQEGRGAVGFSLADREQITEEARALCQVEHPNIVRFYNFQTDESGDLLGIVMEYARGSSLDRKLQNEGTIRVNEAVAVGIALASALLEVHQVGLVHRDIKPGNVIESNGVYKLIDFGIASGAQRSRREAQMRRIVLRALPQDVKGTRLTAFADTLLARGDKTLGDTAEIPSGTLGYIDPDCIAHLSPATQSSDLYSLGALLYEALSGMVPAAAAAIVEGGGGLKPEVVDGRERPPPLADVAPEAPPRLAALIDRLLDPDHQKRPSSALVIKEELESLLAAPDPPAPATATATRREGMGKAVGGVASVVVVVGTFVAVWLASRVPDPPVAPLPPADPSAAGPVDADALSASAAPAITESAEPPLLVADEPQWRRTLAEAQRLLTSGDLDGAWERLRTAEREGGDRVVKDVQAHLKLATAGTQPCKLQAFSYPKLGYVYAGEIGRPSVAAVPTGAVVVWTDDHARTGHAKAYSVVIDPTGHPVSRTRDLTPEGDRIFRPSVTAVGDRVVLLYWDMGGGPEYAGVRVRWLAPDGRIAGASVPVDRGYPVNLWPSLTRAPGGFVVAWQDDCDHKDSDEVFLRRLDEDLHPIGAEAQATRTAAVDASARTPTVAATSDLLLLAYVLKTGSAQAIKLRRFPLGAPDASIVTAGGKSDPVTILGERSAGTAPEAPQVGCGKDGCFIVWYGERTGTLAALIDVEKGVLPWRNRFAPAGVHPALASNEAGDLLVGYFEDGRVKVTPISGDGVGAPSVVGRAAWRAEHRPDPPRPWIAPGRTRREWLVAWQEWDGGEPYVARIECAP